MTWMLQDEAATPYLNVCNYAANSDEFFKQFKSHPAYRHVLEHVSYEEGQQYLKEIEIDYLDKLQEVKQNDSIGEPTTYEYPLVGTMSPTTIRYIKNTSDNIDISSHISTINDGFLSISNNIKDEGLLRSLNALNQKTNNSLNDFEKKIIISI